jgi:hypothetical protein
MMMARHPCPPLVNHARALSIAITSASNAVCLVPSDSDLWAMALPVPSLVITHPRPADCRKDPSVKACTVGDPTASVGNESGM